MRPHRRLGHLLPYVAAAIFVMEAPVALAFRTAQPLNGCTFYKNRLIPRFASCAEFSVVLHRNHCENRKYPLPPYPGDDLQMWLPDYFIEITKHAGASVFAESADAAALKAQLAIGQKWWEASTKVPMFAGASRDRKQSQALTASGRW